MHGLAAEMARHLEMKSMRTEAFRRQKVSFESGA